MFGEPRSAFPEKDLDKVMLDYDEASIVATYNSVTGEAKDFKGLVAIRQSFVARR